MSYMHKATISVVHIKLCDSTWVCSAIPSSSFVTGVSSCLRCLVKSIASSVPLSHCVCVCVCIQGKEREGEREREREKERKRERAHGYMTTWKSSHVEERGFTHKTATEMCKHPQGFLSNTQNHKNYTINQTTCKLSHIQAARDWHSSPQNTPTHTPYGQKGKQGTLLKLWSHPK